ncbi:YSIRK-type signal peptide-containing protein [Streptococcus sp. 2A/TPW/M5]
MRSERQQRFSFRKYAVGLVSVLVGCLFVVRLFWLRSRKGN